MNQEDILTALLLEDAVLTLEDLAHACAVPPQWVVERVEAGVLAQVSRDPPGAWRFRGDDLARARRLCALERDFDANLELAALAVDLMEEVTRLRARLRCAGLE